MCLGRSGRCGGRCGMAEDRYPILVERFTGDQVTALGCQSCGWQRQATEGEIGLFDGLGMCDECGGWLEWAYFEVDPCPGCGELGFFEKSLGYCCSRRCMLQAEYARALEARRAVA